MSQIRKTLIVLANIFLLASCTGRDAAIVDSTTGQAVHTVMPTNEAVNITPQAMPEPVPGAFPSATPDNPADEQPLCVCSPIENITLDEITEILSNPFAMPASGKDDGHHGADFAFYRFKDMVGMDGLSVNSLLPGTVAAVIIDRPPYGNTVIVETPLSDLPPQLLALLNLPEPQPTVEPFAALYCPELIPAPDWDYDQRSVYFLYAHMKDRPDLSPGDPVGCCQPLGEVGTTGISVNEHLHLELRVGPSGAHFASMAHYENSCTTEEMANYCVWRVSNAFQLIDPVQYIHLLQDQQR